MTLLSTSALAISLGNSVAQANQPGPVELVDALNNTFGLHNGMRASHAKGLCIKGSFEPGSELRRSTLATLFAGPQLDAIGRFSIGGGNPAASDKSRTVRGMSLRIGGQYDLVLISEPVFFAATPESFVSFLQARVPDPQTRRPDPDKIAAHNIRYPDGKAQPQLLAQHPAPASYATTPYFSTHAFRFEPAQGNAEWMRLSLQPEAGTHYLDTAAEANLPDSFLTDELGNRLLYAPVTFQLIGQLRGPKDSLIDSTQIWQSREQRILGRLSVTALADSSVCDSITFLPTTLPQGIEPADDPILKARAAAYAISLGKRQEK